MKVISICNHKGGSGKTTCAVHVAAALGLSGFRTLAIDLDPQGFMTRMLGLEEPVPEESVLGLFGMEARFDRVPKIAMHGFDVISSSHRLTSFMKHLTKPTDVFWLKEVLAENREYDYILIDSSSAITVYTLNSLVASDFVVIPVVPEHLPVIGAQQTYKTARLVTKKLNPDLVEPFFLLSQVDARRSTHAKYTRYLRRSFGSQVFHHVVRTSSVLADETTLGRTVFQTNLRSRGAIDFANVTDELLQRMAEKAKSAPEVPVT